MSTGRPSRRPSASLVIALVALFIALGSGAYAASKIGTKQLKNKAVTTKKLDGKAVTTKKLASKAVSAKKLEGKAVKTNKLAPGAVTGSKIDAASVPLGQVVHTTTSDDDVTIPTGAGTEYPLDGSYTQKAGETDIVAAALDVRIEASCTQPRSVVAYVFADPVDPMNPSQNEIVAYGLFQDTGAGTVSGRIDLGPLPTYGTRPLFRSDTDVERKLLLYTSSNCAAGDGATATFGGIDVIRVG